MFDTKNIKNGSSAIIFTAIAVWYAITNFIWLTLNTPNFPCYDSSALHFLYIFAEHKGNTPLMIWIFQFLLSFFGNHNLEIITICVNYVFFLIPLYFIYKIGKETDSKEAGNIAMILFALVPAIYGLSRQFGHKDFHIIAPLTAGIYCLIKTNYFSDRKYSILYGIWTGIGLLTKDTILIFILPTFFWTVTIALKEKFEINKMLNIFVSLLAGSFVAGWIFFEPYSIKKIIYDPITLVTPVFSPENVRVMTFGLYEELLSPPIFLLFLAGLVYFFTRCNKNKILLLLWIFIPWAIIFVMPHYKVVQYFTGLIVPTVLVCAIFLANIKYKIIKQALIIFLIIIGVVQYINFSYYPKSFLGWLSMDFHGIYLAYYNTGTENIMNFGIKNKCEKILKVIKHIKNKYPASNYAVYVTRQSQINNKVFRVCMLLNGMRCKVVDIEKFKILDKNKVVIIVGTFLKENALRRQELLIENHPLIADHLDEIEITEEEYLEEYAEHLQKQVKILDKRFKSAEVFYFNDVVHKDNKIEVFKRKNK